MAEATTPEPTPAVASVDALLVSFVPPGTSSRRLAEESEEGRKLEVPSLSCKMADARSPVSCALISSFCATCGTV